MVKNEMVLCVHLKEHKISTVLSTKKTAFFLLLTLAISSCHIHHQLPNTTDNTANDKLISKYASLLNVPVGMIKNITLYKTVDSWMNTPYKYGGSSHQGTDCSGLADAIYLTVYNKTLPRISRDIFDKCKVVKRKDLKEGDLVFFKIKSSHVSHMGIYLANNYFVHASTGKGVIISNLNDSYYDKYFYKGGRIDDGVN